MQNTFIGQQTIFLDVIDSTNNYAAKRLKSGKIPSGTVIMTDKQTNGRGQRGKEWQSDAFSNLMVSITVDLNEWKIENILSLNHIVSLGVEHFLSKTLTNVALKWPNDCMVNDKKIAGILIENFLSSTKRKSVIGIGININQEKFIADRATSYWIETGKKHKPKELLPTLIDALNRQIQRYHEKGETAIFNAYNEKLWKKNQLHQFEENGEIKEGRIKASTVQGKLQVQFKKHLIEYGNGEVKY